MCPGTSPAPSESALHLKDDLTGGLANLGDSMSFRAFPSSSSFLYSSFLFFPSPFLLPLFQIPGTLGEPTIAELPVPHGFCFCLTKWAPRAPSAPLLYRLWGHLPSLWAWLQAWHLCIFSLSLTHMPTHLLINTCRCAGSWALRLAHHSLPNPRAACRQALPGAPRMEWTVILIHELPDL